MPRTSSWAVSRLPRRPSCEASTSPPVALSGNKRSDKNVYRHSGYPGGLKQIAYGDLLDKDARKAIEKSVRGMLPKNRLGRQLITKLKVYAGPDHPHAAQKPQPFEITQISQ
jgi:large subunit ribosomal protein L13